MPTSYSNWPGSNIESVEELLKAAIQSWNYLDHDQRTGQLIPCFVTVSRQPGAGADLFSHRLAQRLNQTAGANWAAWDHELIEKESAEQGISKRILEMIEERPHSWIDSLLQNLSPHEDTPDAIDLRAYKKVMLVIRALAQAGHAIIVGQGGVFITAGMPGGIHVRLIAPLEHRIKCIAERNKFSPRQAAEHISNTEHLRAMFYRHYWPTKSMAPETFTLALNSAELSVDELVECVLALIRKRESGQ